MGASPTRDRRFPDQEMQWPYSLVRPQKLGQWPLDWTKYESVGTRFRKDGSAS